MAHSVCEVGGHLGISHQNDFLASAYSMLASAACAQYAAPGGFAPFAIDAQGAAAASAAANAGANDPNNGRCYTELRGRGGQQYLCDDQPSPPPPKK